MSSIDDLFKRPNLPNSIAKRKREPTTASALNSYYKAAKTTPNGDVKGKQHTTVEDEEPHENGVGGDDDEEAGPELPPDEDEEAGPMPEDEEGGRFFGGGVNRHTNDVLDYMEAQEGDAVPEPEKIDNAWLRRKEVGLGKKISKNRELRNKFEDDPMKFIESEGELDAEIKSLSILSEHPELYKEFAKVGGVDSLVQLLIHENTDIAINVITILAELTDEDVAAEDDQWDALVEAMLEAYVVDLVLGVLGGLDEEKDEDREGVYHALELIENLCSNAATLENVIIADEEDKLLKYLLERAQKPEKPVSQNKQYAAELLSIIASQASPDATDTTSARSHLVAFDAIDTILQLLASYRKFDPPRDTDEEEYAENLFDALDCLVDAAEGKTKFVEAEGIELALIMMREGGKFSKPRALRLLDHSASGSSEASIAVCQHFVEAAGLKPLFKSFMSMDERKDKEAMEHVLGLLASFLRCLPGDTPGRIRTLAKFTERKHEKLGRLCSLHNAFLKRLEPVNEEVKKEQAETPESERQETELDWIGRRLDAGLFSLQLIDVIIAWLIAEDEEASKKVHEMLGDEGVTVVKTTITEQMNGLGEETEDERSHKDMLNTLIEFLN